MTNQNTQVLKILNLAMSMSIIIYGGVLVSLGKLQTFTPGANSPLEMLALGSTLLLLASIGLYQAKVASGQHQQVQTQFYIICLAIHEFIALMGFVASFIDMTANGFCFLTCALVGLVGNIYIFPRNGRAN